MSLFQESGVQLSLARVLYIWCVRHPASGYVQGINDLAAQFMILFSQDQSNKDVKNTDNHNAEQQQQEEMNKIEADTYWCLTKLLDGIQDNYTFAQPGIQRYLFNIHPTSTMIIYTNRMMHKLGELVKRIDTPLSEHLTLHDIHMHQFSFPWMNCLLVRAFPMHLSVRIWDSYLAETEPYSILHVYVCAAFLCTFSAELRSFREFEQILLFLQNIPTQNWTLQQIDILLSQA